MLVFECSLTLRSTGIIQLNFTITSITSMKHCGLSYGVIEEKLFFFEHNDFFGKNVYASYSMMFSRKS